MRRHQNLEPDWEGADICGATHSFLPVESFCHEPVRHLGPHVVRDEDGQFESTWTVAECADREQR